MQFAKGEDDQDDRVKVVAELNKEDMEWELVDKVAERISKKYECCPQNYTSINYTFTLQRRSTLYTYTVILPIVCMFNFTQNFKSNEIFLWVRYSIDPFAFQ